jgi:ribonuclease Z
MAQALCEALELPQAGDMCTTNWHTLAEVPDQLVLETELYTVYTTPVRHTRPTLATKIVDHQSGRTMVFSADTEPCHEIEDFAKGATTLIHEATTADPNEGYGHSTPRQAGEIAARSGAEQLVLIHYSAYYTMPEDKAIAEVRAGGFTGNVATAREFDSYPA